MKENQTMEQGSEPPPPDSREPIHARLSAYLRERIRDGRLAIGARLPTELELAEEHHVSRDTIRQALATLVEEGLLERTPRRGTFVRRALSVPRSSPYWSVNHICLILNRPPVAQINNDILIGVEQAAKSHGYFVNYAFCDEDFEQEARDIRLARQHGSKGFIIFPIGDATYDPTVWQLKAEEVPFVLIDRYFPDLDCDYVGPENREGAYHATEHLLILGHRRIGFFHVPTESLMTTSVRERWQGYQDALQAYGIPYDEHLLFPGHEMNKDELLSGYEAIFSQPSRPDAVFAVNDVVALDVIAAASRCQLRVPEDLAVVGFDDLSFARHVRPALTTVAQPLLEIGLRAGHHLISMIENPSKTTKQVRLATSLIVRESCGAKVRTRA